MPSTIAELIERINYTKQQLADPGYSTIGRANLVAALGEVIVTNSEPVIEGLKAVADDYLSVGTKVLVLDANWVGGYRGVGYVKICTRGLAYVTPDPDGKDNGLQVSVEFLVPADAKA